MVKLSPLLFRLLQVFNPEKDEQISQEFRIVCSSLRAGCRLLRTFLSHRGVKKTKDKRQKKKEK